MIDPLPPLQPCEDCGFLMMQVGWNEEEDGLSNGFRSGVAEYPLGPLIPGLDNAVQIFTDNGIVGGATMAAR